MAGRAIAPQIGAVLSLSTAGTAAAHTHSAKPIPDHRAGPSRCGDRHHRALRRAEAGRHQHVLVDNRPGASPTIASPCPRGVMREATNISASNAAVIAIGLGNIEVVFNDAAVRADAGRQGPPTLRRRGPVVFRNIGITFGSISRGAA